MDRPAPPKMHGADSPTKITKFTDHEKAAAAFVRAVHRAAGTPGARGRGYLYQEWTVEQGDSTPLIHVAPVPVFQRPADLRRYRRLVDAVKKVYPIAKTARAKMAEMEAELLRLPTKKKEQKAYIKQVYDEIKDEYTPVLKHMTRTQRARTAETYRPRNRPHGLRRTARIPRRIRGGILAGHLENLRAGPQVGLRQGGRRPHHRTDRSLLRSGPAVKSGADLQRYDFLLTFEAKLGKPCLKT